MQEREVFKPKPLATVCAIAALPLVALLVAGFGVGLLVGLTSDPMPITLTLLNLIFGVVLVLGGFGGGILAVAVFRGWFRIEVDSTALSLVGLFGLGRLRMPWNELEGVGLVKWRGVRFLSVKPAKPWPDKPTPKVMRWEAGRNLLLICGVERWSRPVDELLTVLRENAGAKWQEWLAEPLPDFEESTRPAANGPANPRK